jgi:hypothetical protein
MLQSENQLLFFAKRYFINFVESKTSHNGNNNQN